MTDDNVLPLLRGFMEKLSKNSYKGAKDLTKARATHAKNSARWRASGKIKKTTFDLVIGNDDEIIEAFSTADSKIGLLREMFEVYKKSTSD